MFFNKRFVVFSTHDDLLIILFKICIGEKKKILITVQLSETKKLRVLIFNRKKSSRHAP